MKLLDQHFIAEVVRDAPVSSGWTLRLYDPETSEVVSTLSVSEDEMFETEFNMEREAEERAAMRSAMSEDGKSAADTSGRRARRRDRAAVARVRI